MTTREQCIAAFGDVLAEATVALYTGGTPAEAAARSVGVVTGRVSLEDMTGRITQLRADAATHTSAAPITRGTGQRRITRKSA